MASNKKEKAEVSLEEYHKALKTIDLFHEQHRKKMFRMGHEYQEFVRSKVINPLDVKTPVHSFNLSPRLLRGLKAYFTTEGEGAVVKKEWKKVTLKDLLTIDRAVFFQLKNVGSTTINELNSFLKMQGFFIE